MSNGFAPDPDDYFKDTRMSFVDHIEDLRNHLWRAIYGFLIALLGSFFIGHYVLEWITAPVKSQLEAFYDRQVDKVLSQRRNEIARGLNRPTAFREYLFYRPQIEALLKGRPIPPQRPVALTPDEVYYEKNPPSWFDRNIRGIPAPGTNPILNDSDAEQHRFPEEELPEHTITLWVAVKNPLFNVADTSGGLRELLQFDKPTTLTATEGFFVWFKVCLMCGLVIGSPWIFWQIWMFVAAGLYEEEKKLVHVYLPVSLVLFLGGVFLCQIFVIPKALAALLWFNEWLGFKPDMRLNEWLSFAIYMPLVFGISFQTPLVMLLLNRIGIMDIETFRGHRKIAWFIMAIFAALITPSTDALSMLFLWVPMSLLFELGIVLIAMSPKPEVEEDLAESDELVEV
jgi:sec-independent protein translocase protein TatC